MTFTSSSGKQLELGFFMQAENGAVTISCYSPYWFVNKTGMDLSYRVLEPDTIFNHSLESANSDLPLLVSVASKATTKRKIQLKVGESDWSDKFSIDTVGSAGTVVCKFRGFYAYNVSCF